MFLAAWDEDGGIIGQVRWTPDDDAAFVGLDTEGVPIAMVTWGNDNMWDGWSYSESGADRVQRHLGLVGRDGRGGRHLDLDRDRHTGGGESDGSTGGEGPTTSGGSDGGGDSTVGDVPPPGTTSGGGDSAEGGNPPGDAEGSGGGETLPQSDSDSVGLPGGGGTAAAGCRHDGGTHLAGLVLMVPFLVRRRRRPVL